MNLCKHVRPLLSNRVDLFAMNTTSAERKCDLNDPPSQPPSEEPLNEDAEENIDESEYPGPGRLTAIFVSLVFSIFLVKTEHLRRQATLT